MWMVSERQLREIHEHAQQILKLIPAGIFFQVKPDAQPVNPAYRVEREEP
jgi:hypothetical protein